MSRTCSFLSGILIGFARLFFYKSVEKVGALFTSSFSPSAPIISVLLAVIILSERPWIGLFMGLACIVVGSIIIEASMHKGSIKGSRTSWMTLPILYAFTAGFNDVLRKQALLVLNQPLFGTTIAYTSTLLLYTILILLTNNMAQITKIENFKYFWKSGLAIAIGQLSSFCALSIGEVVKVAPLIYTEPLFVFMLSKIINVRSEKVSWKPVLDASTILLGILFLSIY
jgi:uncharacterized membrane protein